MREIRGGKVILLAKYGKVMFAKVIVEKHIYQGYQFNVQFLPSDGCRRSKFSSISIKINIVERVGNKQ